MNHRLVFRLLGASALGLIVAAAPSAAAPQKKSAGPVVDFFERITAPPAPARKKQPASRKGTQRPVAETAAKPVSGEPAGASTAKPKIGTAAAAPVPRPAPVQRPKAAPPDTTRAAAGRAKPRSADDTASSGGESVRAAPATPPPAKVQPVEPAAPRSKSAAASGEAPPAPAKPDAARLIAAEPVRVARGAWEAQTHAAMFAAEPTLPNAVFPPLGSRLAAVAPIDLRTGPASAAAAAPPRVGEASPAAIEPVPLPRLPPVADAEVKLAALPPAEPPAPDPACVDLLAAGVESAPAEAIVGAGECGAPWPVRVAAIATEQGRVAIEPPAVMRCGVARSLARWLRENAAPTAKATFGSELRAIGNAAGYDCRPRNGVQGAKLSEHGRANALDIGSFVLANGRRIVVGQDVPEDQAFVGEVRTAACLYMHTVLGPGSDPSHAEHLHLDMAPRGKTGDVRWCK